MPAFRNPIRNADHKLSGYWSVQMKCPCAVPTGLATTGWWAYPTLKCGANILCAYGALTALLLETAVLLISGVAGDTAFYI